jgi:hypothetical protein
VEICGISSILCQGVDFTFLGGVQGWNPWLRATPLKSKSMGWRSTYREYWMKEVSGKLSVTKNFWFPA